MVLGANIGDYAAVVSFQTPPSARENDLAFQAISLVQLTIHGLISMYQSGRSLAQSYESLTAGM